MVSTPVFGSTCRCRHWPQISFIMHCIGELIEPIAVWPGLRYWAQHCPARRRDRSHHTVRADGNDVIGRSQRDSLRPEPIVPRRLRSPRQYCRQMPCPAVRPGAKPGASSQHQTMSIRRALDFLDLVAVDVALVASEIQNASCRSRARLVQSITTPRCRARRRPATRVLPVGNFGRRSGRTHQDDRFARAKRRTQIGANHPSPAQSATADRDLDRLQRQSRAIPSIANRVPPMFAEGFRSSAAGRIAPA